MTRISYSFLFLFFSFVLVFAWSEKPRHELENNLVRMHILANSDSTEDQQVKITVRDAILDLSRRKGTTPCLSEMEEEANRILDLEGKSYRAEVHFGEYTVSRRAYDGFVLPYGKYTAVTLKLGEGTGKNWWCVLSPPLCFTSSAFGTADGLDSCLSPETAQIINTGNITVKFRILEIASGIASGLANITKQPQ